MASKAAKSLAARVLRPRTSQSFLSHNARMTRRTMSTGHGSHEATSSDKPWIIASALVTAVGSYYILSPSKKDAHHHSNSDHAHVKEASKEKKPAKEEKAPEPEPEQSSEPKDEVKEEEPVVKDDEGTEVPAKEVQESIDNAVKSDSPPDAKANEAVHDGEKEPEPQETKAGDDKHSS